MQRCSGTGVPEHRRVGSQHRATAGHCLGWRQSEAFVERWEDEACRSFIEGSQFAVADKAGMTNPGRQNLGPVVKESRPDRAGDDEVEARVWQCVHRVDQQAKILVLGEAPDGQYVWPGVRGKPIMNGVVGFDGKNVFAAFRNHDRWLRRAAAVDDLGGRELGNGEQRGAAPTQQRNREAVPGTEAAE